jgi:5-methylcytosine-specific restriction protein A
MFGYYPVYLFSADFKSVYLSLNQGWTQYERRYKPTSKAKETIVQNATKLKNVLISPLREFLFQPINLNTNNTLGVGYELGHVCGVRYNSDALPENEVLLNDLRNMIGVYRELKGKVGTDIFNLENIDLEESEPKSSPEDDKVVKDSLDKIQGDEEIKNALKKLEEKYFAEPPERKKRLGYAFARNKKLADLVKKIAGYKCYNCKLPGFEKKNGELYAEAHHIWELGKEGKDIPTNLICVCANCHRKIHYGKEAILVNH